MSANQWRSVVDLWRDSCAKYPDYIAVEDGFVQWTYRDLEQRVEAWAAAVCEVSPLSAHLAIQLPHSAESIAALLGILVAGRSFVALDLTHPIGQRVAQIRLCDARILICRAEDEAALRQAEPGGTFIFPESIRSGNRGPRVNIQPDWIAYFHFTSGSSGKPKTVALPHRTATAGASFMQAMLTLSPEDRHALLSPLAVPATTPQVLAVLSAGAALCLFEARAHSIADLAEWLTDQQIATTQTVPTLLRSLIRFAAGRKLWPALRAVKLGGEPALASDAELFAGCAAENAMLVNGLGLTETGFNVCWSTWRCGQSLVGDLMPIGRPPPTVELVVESTPGRPILNGGIGEIVVRSPSLPAGYWNDSDPTASVYRELPERPGWRELRTGDAGRWRSDGLLEYTGRLDDMIKIRGHRIVPTEVEAAILALSDVEAAALVVRRDVAGNQLHAFVQLRSGAGRNSEQLRRDLATKLPGYMLPAKIRLVDSLPHLPNGKIDRIWLSERILLEDRVVPPEPADLLTLQLVQIWQDALGSKQIGITDDFFALGGDSLAGATILAAAEKFLGINLSGAALLEAPTIEKLAALIRNGGWKERDLRVVALRLGGRKAPLYCVPGAGCDVVQLRLLANHLSDDQPVFAFHPLGLDGRSSCQRSIEEMAESYVGAMRLYQSRGPYYLCGSSFGGVVAFEMARRLLAEGQEVKFLGLFDSYGGKYPKRRQQLAPRKWLQFALWHSLPLDRKHIFTLSSFSRGLMHWGARRVVDLGLFLNVRAPRRPYKLRFFYLEEVCLLARRRYQLKPFHGTIHLFRAEHQPPSDLFEPDPVLGWGGMATGGIEIHQLSGYHRAYLSEPGVAVLAEKLTSCLAAAASSNVDFDSRLSPASNKREPAVSIGS